MSRRVVLLSILTALAMGLGMPAASPTASQATSLDALRRSPATAGVHPDFNGDGWADLAVGGSSEDVQTVADAGQINVLYGSASGPSAVGDQIWNQASPGVLDVPEASDAFGFVQTFADFNGDGFDDVALSVFGEDVGAIVDAGAVSVLYGSAMGLTATGNQLWTQDSPGILDDAETSDNFGIRLKAVDFNGDGFGDLAVGAVGEDVGDVADAGAVNVLYGSAVGLTATGNQLWTQDSPDILDDAEGGDLFGGPFGGADFNGDGFADLAIGVSNEDLGTLEDAGAVNVLYGSAAGLTATGNQLWTQDSPGILDAAETGDRFGFPPATGDFNGDGFADLAVGILFEDIGSVVDAGAVSLIYGSAAGLTATGNQLWGQGSPGVLDAPETGDQFSRPAAGDYNADGFDDMAVGVIGEDVGTIVDAGAVGVIFGSAAGLVAAGNQLWSQGSPGILDTPEAGDLLGSDRSSSDFNGDGFTDLAIGLAGEDVGTIVDAGAVAVLFGSPGGLAASGNQLWSQNSPGVLDTAETGDNFGGSIAK